MIGDVTPGSLESIPTPVVNGWLGQPTLTRRKACEYFVPSLSGRFQIENRACAPWLLYESRVRTENQREAPRCDSMSSSTVGYSITG
jgi:hypothetical protein